MPLNTAFQVRFLLARPARPDTPKRRAWNLVARGKREGERGSEREREGESGIESMLKGMGRQEVVGVQEVVGNFPAGLYAC